MNSRQLTALLAALVVLPTANAQQTLSGGSTITITGSNITTTGTPTNIPYKQPQMFKGPDGSLLPASSYWSLNRVPSPPGALNCVNCGTTDADFVGPYALSMTCPTPGTAYRGAWGGTCWACPGPIDQMNPYEWQLKGDPANGGTCFRALRTWLYAGSKMTKGGVSSGVMSWDCGSGEFWQMYDNKGNWTWWGGACYSCPAGYGWNARSPTSGSDCVKPDDFAQPRVANFNGCPQPDARKMGLAGQRTPDKPFLDIAGGWSQGVASGGCFACPAVLDDGSIAVTTRNVNTLIGRPKGNNGCDIKVSYKPKPFPEPGLMGIDGIRDLILEQLLFSVPKVLTRGLHAIAEANGIAADSAAARQFVKNKWDEIAANPAASAELRAIIYGMLREAALKQAPTEAEKAAIAAFSEYIRQRKMYLADIALNMYDTWKLENDKQMAARMTPMTSLFYYGVAPFDFEKVVEAGLGLGTTTAAGLAMAATGTAYGNAVSQSTSKIVTEFLARPENIQFGTYENLARWRFTGGPSFNNAQQVQQAAEKAWDTLQISLEKNSEAMRVQNIFRGNFGRNLFSLRTALSIGPALVMVATSILLSIAIESVIAQATARPKLLAAKTAAAAPVNLGAMISDPAGDDIAFLFWTKAMEGPAYADPALAQLAAAANKLEAARGYAK